MTARLWLISTIICAFSATGTGTLSAMPLSPADLSSELKEIRDPHDLSAEIFYLPRFGSTAQDLQPAHSVETGARCLIKSEPIVAQLAAMMSRLKVVQAGWAADDPSVEIRFWRSGRMIFSGIFVERMGNSGDKFKPGRGFQLSNAGVGIVDGLVNDHSASFKAEPVQRLLDFARTNMSGPSAGEVCVEFRK
jgi:hypothetical protein